MSTTEEKYSTLYGVTVGISVGRIRQSIDSADISSIAIIHQYDTMTYPIIRIRLYSDLSLVEFMNTNPDDIKVSIIVGGAICRIRENESPTLVKPTSDVIFGNSFKGYIETKNTPTSFADMYDNGVARSSDLNVNKKVPIEIYCYQDDLIHKMKSKVQSVYKKMSIQTATEDMFRRLDINNFTIDPIINQKKFDQILIPNLDIADTIAFFDDKYGLYPKGGQLYCDTDKVYLTNSDVNNGQKAVPIYVDNGKTNSDISGIRKIGNYYYMQTLAAAVSIISETEIEKTLRSEKMSNINLNNLNIDTATLQKLYGTEQVYDIMTNVNQEVSTSTKEKITTPVMFNKAESNYHASIYEARVNERITRVDISGIGFDAGLMKVNTRYNLIFDSPIRGANINQMYRATFVNHVFTKTSGNFFNVNTTMNLCSN